MHSLVLPTLGESNTPSEVTADSLFEAAALGLEAFNGIKLTESRPGLATILEVAVQPPHVIHRVRIQQLRDWLKGTSPSPKEQLLKQRLKAAVGE